MTRVPASELREGFAEMLSRVAQADERIVLHVNGKNVAALVSMKDLALLEKLEEQMDLEEAERRLADPGEVPIPYETVRKELGLA